MVRRILVTALVASVFMASVPAQIAFTVSPRDDNLRMVDVSTQMTLTATPMTLAGDTIFGANGLTEDPNTGTVYVILQTANALGRILATLDLATGTATAVGDTGDFVANIAFDCNGTLFAVLGDGAAAPESLQTVNLTNGALTFFAGLGNGDDGEALGFDPGTNLLYHASGLGSPIYESVDPSSGFVAPIGYTGTAPAEAHAIGFMGAGQFAMSDLNQDLHMVDTAGNIVLLGTLDHEAKGILFPGIVTCVGPTYPGSGEDFTIATGVNSAPSGFPDQKPATGGDFLGVGFISPMGTFNGGIPVLVGQLFVTGSPPMSPPGFPEIHIGATGVVLFDGTSSGIFGLVLLPPTGMFFGYAVPALGSGVSIMLQALVLSPLASNGIFAATNGHEIQL